MAVKVEKMDDVVHRQLDEIRQQAHIQKSEITSLAMKVQIL